MSEEEWRSLLAKAYQGDPCSRSLMDAFSERVAELTAKGIALEYDTKANALYTDLLLAVRAYVEGKPIKPIASMSLETH